MKQVLDLLAFGAHPDDVELGCGATLIKHIQKGYNAGIIDLTLGERGTRGTPDIRLAEAKDAQKIIGATVRENLKIPDCFFENTKPYQLKVIEMLRKYKPKVVLTNAPDDRHPDHGRAMQLVTDSCFLSGLGQIETFNDEQKQEAWRPEVIYHYIQFKNLKPDMVVDVSAEMGQKLEAVKAHQSQFFNEDSSDPETFISKPDFLNILYERARDLGRLIGVQYAEGFLTHRYIGIDNLFDLR